MPTLSTLFDAFSDNLALYKMDCRGRFMCPLCLRTFPRDRIRTDLSKAHMIPQRLGGRLWTLACKKCNNRVGTEIESYEAERANFNWALSGDGAETTRVLMDLPDGQGGTIGPVSADMRATKLGGDRRLQIFTKPKGSNPDALKKLDNVLPVGPSADTGSIQVHYRVTRSAKRANLTYVHAAYLFMFHQFGYEWVLDPCTTLIRKQMASPDESIILPMAATLSDPYIPSNELSILLVIEPPSWRHFLVVLPLLRGWLKRQAVWMPLFGRSYEQPPERKGVQLKVVPVPDHHQFLRYRTSKGQGRRFILDHFAYDPVLQSGSDSTEEQG